MNKTTVLAVVMSVAWARVGAAAIGPKYQRPSAPVPANFKEEAPEGWKQAQPADGALPSKWWEIYGDERLNELEAQVNLTNENVLAAEALYRQAQAAIGVARSGLVPSVSVGAQGADIHNLAGTSGSFAAVTSLSYQLDVWGSIRKTVAANSATAQASAAQLQSAQLLYQSALATNYFQIQGLDASRELLEATVKSYEQYLQLTRDRLEGGVASGADVALAETQLESARTQLIDLGVQRAQAEHAIAVLTGKPPAQLSLALMPLRSVPPPVPLALPSALLERRPDVAAAERQAAAANEQIGIAKAAYFPALTLTGSAGTQAAALANLFLWPARVWTLGPQLAETVFNGGKRRAQVRLAEAAYDATVANYRQSVLSALQQTEDALAQLRILEQESDVASRAVAAANRSLEISTIQYRGGLANYLQVITAQTNALQAQRTALNVLTRRMLASVSLVQALGGGWDVAQLPSTQSVRKIPARP